MSLIQFRVFGLAAPAGSKTSGVTKKGVRFVRDSNPASAEWKRAVMQKAGEVMQAEGLPLFEGPLVLELEFFRPRPKGHYKADGKALSKKGAETPFPVGRPDATKLTRAVEDAMTGVVYRDDSQIIHQVITKNWGELGHVEVKVYDIGSH